MRATALVLDVAHRGRVITVDVPRGVRPLAVLGLNWPLGHRDDAFVFIEQERQPDRAWTGNRAMWQLYVDAVLGGWEPPTRNFDVFYFGATPEQAARLAHHVVKGKKRGTTGWIAALEREGATIPTPGLVSIVTDGFGIPLCAIETERVITNRFGDAPEDIAIAEAEGDCSLDDWRTSHRAYFEREGARIGTSFHDDSLVLHEYFRVLRVFSADTGR
jgi:uncharacterized protein YhfF